MKTPERPHEPPGSGRAAILTLLVGLALLPLFTSLSWRVSAYCLALLILRIAAFRWPLLLPGRWQLLVLTLAGGANVYATYHSLAGQHAGTALLATMLTLKLLEVRALRDLRMGTILFGFLLVTQFLFNQSPWLLLYLTALMVANFALMADLTARASRQPIQSALRLAWRLTLQALPLALVLFVLFPRLSAPLWNLYEPSTRARTGITDRLEPGAVSELVLDGGLAFRVRFEDRRPSAGDLYWRGPVLWHTDGRRWLPGRPGSPTAEARAPLSSTELLRYSILLEPSGQRWIFALDLPLHAPPGARMNADHTVLADKPVDAARAYPMVSALSYRTGALSPDEEQAALAVPANVTARMRALVGDWLVAGGPEAVVREGLRFFREEPFHYTLLPPLLGANPADEFLFETRRGFCEHYASAFALLMRIAGIPSRIVLGYLGGEPNPIGGHLIVRQSDAHAWVEVWLSGQGWVRVDPTAAVPPSRVERNNLIANLAQGMPLRFRGDGPEAVGRWVHRLRLLADAAETGWRDWVLDWSIQRQQGLLDRIGLGMLGQYGLAGAMIIAAGFVLGLLVLVTMRGEKRRDGLEGLYDTFCRRLATAGLHRRRGEGPADFGRRVGTERPDLYEPVAKFLSLYVPLRYGRTSDEGRLKEARRVLHGFRPQQKPARKAK